MQLECWNSHTFKESVDVQVDPWVNLSQLGPVYGANQIYNK